jgi:hypothetical protein
MRSVKDKNVLIYIQNRVFRWVVDVNDAVVNPYLSLIVSADFGAIPFRR